MKPSLIFIPLCSPGNTGEELSDNPDLYISRDGGITWQETLAESWGISVLDYGGLMVAARDYHNVIMRINTCNNTITCIILC